MGIQQERARRRRRTKTASIIIVLSVVGLIAGLLAVQPDDNIDTSSATPPTTPTTLASTTTTLDRSNLSPVALELVDKIESGRAGTMHILFDVVSQELLDAESTATLEMWRRPGQYRQDTILDEKEGRSKSSLVGGPNGILRCDETPEQALSCQQVASEFTAADDFLSPVLDFINGATVTVENKQLGTFTAACYKITGRETAEVCMDALGFPVRVVSGPITYSAVILDQDVEDGDFQTGIQVSTETSEPPTSPPATIETTIPG